MNENKQQPLLFTVADYNDLKSISSFLKIGENIERAGFSEFSKVEYRIENGYEDLDFLHEFIAHLLTVIKETNKVDKGSLEYLNSSMEYMEECKNRLLKRILDPEESKTVLEIPIEDAERFKKIIEICMDLFNAVRVFVYNETDIHTVSLMVMMHILGTMQIRDENLNYILLKLVGRYNESKASDIDTWLETLEYDRELFFAKDVLDTIIDLAILSPSSMLDKTIYNLVSSPEFVEICAAQLPDHDVDEPINASDLIQGALNYLTEVAIANLDTLVSLVNDVKHEISWHFLDIFESELESLSFYRIITEEFEDEVEFERDGEIETMQYKSKLYKPDINIVDLQLYIKVRLCEYLTASNFIKSGKTLSQPND